MTDFNPSDMIEHADRIAQTMVEDMPEEEAVHMVQDYVRVMAEWQPEVYKNLTDDPVMLAITTLTTSRMFERAFLKAYGFTEKHIEARNAIEKAFGKSS